MSEDPTPAEALAAIARSRREVHDKIATHGWRYDLCYSALVAGLIGSQALDQPFAVAGTSLGIAGLIIIFQQETRRSGVRVTGVSPRQARWVAIGLGLVLATVMIGVVFLKHEVGPDLPLVPITLAVMAAVFALALIGSRLWRRVYRAEMEVRR
jgi:hypothetical protein